MKKYKGYIAVDFDAVLSTYSLPFVHNKFGKPNKEVIKAVNYFYNRGYYIYIYTGRLHTPKIVKWLKKYRVKYHDFNVCKNYYPYTSKAKLYFDCLIDDKAINYHFRNNPLNKKQLITEMKRIFNRHNKKGKK